MNVYILLISSLVLLFCGVVWMRIKKPRAPYMEYKIRFKWYDLIINVFGSWSCLLFAGLFEEQMVKLPHIQTHYITLFTRIISFIICGSYIKYTIHRSIHPGPFIIPSTMNIIASISQSEALVYVAVPEFAASKALRLIVIALLCCKQLKEKVLWVLVSLIGSHFMFMYEFSTSTWILPNHVGIIWLLIFISSDAFTSISQEMIFKKFKIGNVTMMYYINLYVILLMIPQIIFNFDSFGRFLTSLVNNSTYIFYLILLTLSLLFAQFFTLRLIRQFGALCFMTVCIFRSIFIVLIAKYANNGFLDLLECCEVLFIIILASVAVCYRLKYEKNNKMPLALDKI